MIKFNLISIFLISSLLNNFSHGKDNPREEHGLLIHSNSVGYEWTFVSCKKNEVWLIIDDELSKKLLNTYHSIPHTQNGEIYAVVDLQVQNVDKNTFEKSHHTGLAKLINIKKVSSNTRSIFECKSTN